MTLLIYTLAAFGFAYVIGHAKISLPIRTLLQPEESDKSLFAVLRWWILMLLECPACVGFWLGYWTAAFYPAIFRPHLGIFVGIPFCLVVALFTCGTNFVISRFSRLDKEGDQ